MYIIQRTLFTKLQATTTAPTNNKQQTIYNKEKHSINKQRTKNEEQHTTHIIPQKHQTTTNNTCDDKQ